MLSEEAGIRYCARVEAALLKAYVRTFDHLDASLEEEIDRIADKIDPQEVYREEEKTHHNIRALVNVLKREVSPELRPYVHLGATSVDILDTAFRAETAGCGKTCILPLMIEVEQLLIDRM